MFPIDSLDEKLSALRRHWAEVDASAANQLAAQREAIAASVEALGCKCARLMSAKASAKHVPACPLAIATMIREGGAG